jgi:hypothetical protein
LADAWADAAAEPWHVFNDLHAVIALPVLLAPTTVMP